MRSIVIGGGKIGYFLLKTLKERGYDVTLIENDKSACLKIAEDIDADIICGDGTEPDVLRDAGIGRAEIVAAVTGKDEENLVICQIAKSLFGIGKSIARVNNPKNIAMFKELGVDQIVCSTEVIANLIEYEFESDTCKIVQTFDRGAMILIEVIIREGNRWLDRYIKDLELPSECVIASVLRNDRVIYPRGDTRLLKNDCILIITNRATMLEIQKQLHNGGASNVRQKK
jgi:trk system potassium uptake protein TrkA